MDLVYKYSNHQGIPLHPTLGSPTRSLQEIYDLLGDRPFSAEFKYDGQRAQIHGYLDDTKAYVKIFSRHLEDMTDKVDWFFFQNSIEALLNLEFPSIPM